MKVKVNGDVTPKSIETVLKNIEKEYGLKIRDLTMYIRFVDKNGRVVEPKLPANSSELVMTISKEDEKKDEILNHQLSVEEAKKLLELDIDRTLTEKELKKVVIWVTKYHVTYGDLNYAMVRHYDPIRGFDYLDRCIYAQFKAKQKEIIVQAWES